MLRLLHERNPLNFSGFVQQWFISSVLDCLDFFHLGARPPETWDMCHQDWRGEKWKVDPGSLALNSHSLEETHDIFAHTCLASTSHMALNLLQRTLGSEELLEIC